MAEEEFNFEFNETEEAEGPPDPMFRATIRTGRVMLTHWAGWLASGGMWNGMLEARGRAGVAIADLTVAGGGEGELMVRYLSEGRSRADADEALCEWGTHLGYERIWFPDYVVDLEDEGETSSRAEVRCPVCGSRWHDSTPEFWEMVRNAGTFPKWCVICGWELPQWKVVEKRPRSDNASNVTQVDRRG